ncbi:MAG: hypothetical protein IPG44_17530 [Anaerolineales bacterium]|jgi:hypothetical protein|nr:hypothetical protein [Chloroflexota bacterium]MBK6647516.1 hypothetical protein [Anaerolineales bacterium]
MPIRFTSNVQGCAETERGTATRSGNYPPPEIRFTRQAGGFHFHHALVHQCCGMEPTGSPMPEKTVHEAAVQIGR